MTSYSGVRVHSYFEIFLREGTVIVPERVRLAERCTFSCQNCACSGSGTLTVQISRIFQTCSKSATPLEGRKFGNSDFILSRVAWYNDVSFRFIRTDIRGNVWVSTTLKMVNSWPFFVHTLGTCNITQYIEKPRIIVYPNTLNLYHKQPKLGF